jgi:hypothetical protein
LPYISSCCLQARPVLQLHLIILMVSMISSIKKNILGTNEIRVDYSIKLYLWTVDEPDFFTIVCYFIFYCRGKGEIGTFGALPN